VLERERRIALDKATEEAATSGKEIPAEILAKRADGAAAKFAKENALLSQVFVMDNKTPIAQVVEQAGKDVAPRSCSRTMSASSSAKASRRKRATSPRKSRRRLV
jgi:translation elongation factor EF-Ts